MSILPLHRRNTGGMCPYFDTYWPNFGHELDRFFDNFGQIQLRDHVGKLSMGKDGAFTYQLDTSGFQPSELKVSIEGDTISIVGEHKEQNNGESVERSFTRRVTIPAGISKDTIDCGINEKGHMTITGTQAAVQQAKKRTIPIEFKHSSEQPAIKQ